MRWNDLLAWVRDALVAAATEHVTNLRARQVYARRTVAATLTPVRQPTADNRKCG